MASAGHVRRPPSGAAWHEHRSRLLNASWRSIMTSSSLTTDIPDTLTLKHYAGRPVLSSSMYFYYMLYLYSDHAACVFLPGGAPQSCQLSWALINTDHVPHVCTWYDFKLDVIEDFWTNHKQVVTIKFRTVIYFLLCHQNGWQRTFLTIYPLILAVLTNYPTFNVLFKLFTFSYLINHWAYERITRVHS